MKIVFEIILIFLFSSIKAQNTHQLRGSVTDQVLQKPISFATVTIKNMSRTVTTDADGFFRFTDLAVGSYQLIISHTGFKEAVLENIVINTGKETVLSISLEAIAIMEKEVLVKANSKKNRPLNDMSVVSARAFTVEETQKYAAAVNDPLRMATSFAGVMAADDGNNS